MKRIIEEFGIFYHTSGSATGTYRFGDHFAQGSYVVEVVYSNGIKTLKVLKE